MVNLLIMIIFIRLKFYYSEITNNIIRNRKDKNNG